MFNDGTALVARLFHLELDIRHRFTTYFSLANDSHAETKAFPLSSTNFASRCRNAKDVYEHVYSKFEPVPPGPLASRPPQGGVSSRPQQALHQP